MVQDLRNNLLDSSQALSIVRDDPVLREFLSPSVEASQMVGRIDGCLDRVTRCVDILTEQLRILSAERADDLIEQAKNLDALEKDLEALCLKANSILTRVEVIRDKLVEPYNRISQSIVLLNRLKTTCDLLRKMIRVMNISKRIQQQTSFDTKTPAGLRDLVKSAQLLNEFESIIESDPNIKRVNEVQKEIEAVNMIKGLIVDKCDAEFEGGINSPQVTGSTT